MLIHISGASGSGKTTIMDLIHKWVLKNGYDVFVFDPDNKLASIWDRIVAIQNTSPHEQGDMFARDVELLITRYIRKHKCVIICGLLDIMSGDVSYYPAISPDYKFFISVPNKILLAQYLDRIITNINSHEFQTRLLAGTTSIMFNRGAILQWAETTHDIYVKTLRYVPMDKHTLLVRIKKIISTNHVS